LGIKALLNPVKRRLWIKIFAGSCALIVFLALAAWLFPQQILTLDSGEVKADVLVVLGGGGRERPERAAELFKAGKAPLIICTGIGDADSNEMYLTNTGVPARDILLEPNSLTTQENAKFTIGILHSRHLKSAIIVTTWYHSRRALHCFEHYAPDIQFYSRPSYFGYSKTEWNAKGINRHLNGEYVKLLGYWLLYGVCPVQLRK
jgi:uncharacterized SAM-binding protein YcdF (DUF218 family)